MNNCMELKLIDGSTTEQFIAFFEGHRKISDILDFLEFKDMQFSALVSLGKLDEEVTGDLINFYNYFMHNYDESTREARLRIWPEDCLIFQYVLQFDQERSWNEIVTTFHEMPEKMQLETLSLSHVIMDIPGNKYVEMYCATPGFDVTIPGDLDEQCEAKVFDMLKYSIGHMMADRGFALIHVFHDNETVDIYGVQGLPIGTWGTISKADLKEINEESGRLRRSVSVSYYELLRTLE